MSCELLSQRQKTNLLRVVSAALQKYLDYKIIGFDDLHAESFDESSILDTSRYRERAAERKAYCDGIERAVSKLPQLERQIVTDRYMREDYVFDHHVYTALEISEPSYTKYRLLALHRLADKLKLQGDFPLFKEPPVSQRGRPPLEALQATSESPRAKQ